MPKIDPALIDRRDGKPVVRMSALLERPVRDSRGQSIGEVHDVLVVRRGPVLGRFGRAFVLHRFLAGAGAFGDRLGYEREDVKGPLPLHRLFTYLHKRNAVAFEWRDIKAITPEGLRLGSTRAKLRTFEDTSTDEIEEESIYIALRILDSQIIDKHGHMAGNVDDLELVIPPGRGAVPYVAAILAGPGALSHRLGGKLGLWVESVHKRLHPHGGGPARIPFNAVERFGSAVHLTVTREDLDTFGFEIWARDTVISKIPGATGS